ncbi:MAG: HD domain-containing protein [Simkaniaceae bacterium]|nr:HD domain-containing protein [Simkaniaceae bacterium]
MAHLKKIYDALHGFIYLDPVEYAVAQTGAFRRLIGIRQLGVAHLVYPGATHSRFEHSLGVMNIASQIFDRLIEKGVGDVEMASLYEHAPLYRRVLRLGALCHDLGHLPFSHTAEHSIFPDKGHEWMTLQIIEQSELRKIFEAMRGEYRSIGIDPLEMVIKLAIGPKKMKELRPEWGHFSSIEKVLSQMITDDFLGADRMDYLLRDARSTGVPYGAFDYLQLIEMMALIRHEEGGIELGIEEEGLQACESLLLARYFMFNRIYQYPLVKALAFHLTKIIEAYFKERDLTGDINAYLNICDSDIWVEVKRIAQDKQHPLFVHASALMHPTTAYKVIKIPHAELALVDAFKEMTSQFFIEVNPFAIQSRPLDFSVRKKDQTLWQAHQLTELKIPSPKFHLIYAHPDLLDQVESAIKNKAIQ